MRAPDILAPHLCYLCRSDSSKDLSLSPANFFEAFFHVFIDCVSEVCFLPPKPITLNLIFAALHPSAGRRFTVEGFGFAVDLDPTALYDDLRSEAETAICPLTLVDGAHGPTSLRNILHL